MPSLSFVATANSVLYVGATPVFVDIEGLNLPVMSLADAAAKCTERTKAVILMHYAGYTVDRAAWRDFADSRGLLLIEDAAHAAGAEQAGTFGDAAAFSFYGNKNMTTAEGGVVLAANEDVLDKIRQMRGHGMTSGTFQRRSSRISTYDVTMLGYNYRMDEFRAAIGILQLKHLSEWNAKRRKLTQSYMRSLSDKCPDLHLPFAAWHRASNRLSRITSCRSFCPRRPIGSGSSMSCGTRKFRRPFTTRRSTRPPSTGQNFPCAPLPLTEEFARRELALPLTREWRSTTSRK